MTAARTLPPLPAVHPAGCTVARVAVDEASPDPQVWLFHLTCGAQLLVPVVDTPWGCPSPSYTQYLNHQCLTGRSAQ